jgi:hypothetical protein
VWENIQAAKWLFRIGANPNALYGWLWTPLQMATIEARLDFVRWLVEELNVVLKSESSERSPLEYAGRHCWFGTNS